MAEILRAVGGAADGVTATTGNTGASQVTPGTGGTITWSTAMGAYGQTGLRFASAVSQSNLARFSLDAASNQMQLTGYGTTPSVAPASGYVTMAAVRHASGVCFRLGWSASGVLYLVDSANTITTILAAGVLSLNTMYVFEIVATGASTTAGNVQVKVYAMSGGAVGSQVGSTFTITNANLTANNFSAFDLHTGGTSYAATIGWFGVKANNGAGSALAPYAPEVTLDDPVVTVTSVVNPSTIGGSNGTITITWPSVSGADHYEAAIADGTVSSGFVTADADATSPHTFTGVEAGTYTVAVRAIAV